MESEVLVESLGLVSTIFIKIDNSPSLVSIAILAIDDNSLSFNIL
jgi:hypothetical protein